MFNPIKDTDDNKSISRKILEIKYKREYMEFLSKQEFLTVDEAAFYFNLDRKIIVGYCIESKYKNNFPCIYINDSQKPKINREGAQMFFRKLSQLTLDERLLKIRNINQIKENLEEFLAQKRHRRGRPRKVI